MKPGTDSGFAILVALIALALFSLLGLYVSLNASTEVRISDNYEAQLAAGYAAWAGIAHARAVLRGLDFNDSLRGPDGAYNGSPASLQQAKTFAFRNPVPLGLAPFLNISNPGFDLSSGHSDDGILNSGFHHGLAGTALVPGLGIWLASSRSRYFVKASDNNGEASELSGDPLDNPFADGDGIIIIRSLGLAGTIIDRLEGGAVRNSLALLEARFKRRSTFKVGSPLTAAGTLVNATFTGTDSEIVGGDKPGIAIIDTNRDDAVLPEDAVRAASQAHGSITGAGLPEPSVAEITAQVSANTDQKLLLDPGYLWYFVSSAPKYADSVYSGAQDWSAGTPVSLGEYDFPKIVLVSGDLSLSGSLDGAGILIVAGRLVISGSFRYSGLVLLIGTGELIAEMTGGEVRGAVYVFRVEGQGTSATFGNPTVTIGGATRLIADESAVNMAISLIPASQLSIREILSTLDP